MMAPPWRSFLTLLALLLAQALGSAPGTRAATPAYGRVPATRGSIPEEPKSTFPATISQPAGASTESCAAGPGRLTLTPLPWPANRAQAHTDPVYAPGQVMPLASDEAAADSLATDPLIYLEQKIVASGAPEDFFGYAVALSGDTALVGAYRHKVGGNPLQGSAYVFTRSGNTWNLQQKLTASDGDLWGAYFGFSVALSGDTALVGAFAETIGQNWAQGSAYVFARTGTTWSLQQKLTASDGTEESYFGYSVALSGDTALVGAPYDDAGGNQWQGAAYIFTRSGTSWGEQQKLVASDGTVADFFGRSVALSGDTALVGAGTNLGGSGSAYVFTRSGITWNLQQKLTAPDISPPSAGGFGGSVALSEDTALVGASYDYVGTNDWQGSAYVFTRSGTTWTHQQRLTASDGKAGDFFGVSVALSGDTALVGAYRDRVHGKAEQGSAYVFTRDDTTWSERARLTASDGAAGDNFGVSVALSDDGALLGAYHDDVWGKADQGSAYFYFFPSFRVHVPLVIETITRHWSAVRAPVPAA
jgi:hypothetical protein